MRIALVAHSDAPWTPHYARFFTSAGHVVRIFSFCPLPLPGFETIPLTASDEAAGKAVFLTRVPRLRRLLRAFRPDVVFASYLISNGLSAALAWRGPLVVSVRGGDVLDQRGNPPLPTWLRRGLTRFICGRSARVHAVSTELVDVLARWGIPGEKMACFPIGVDIDLFRPGETEGVARNEMVICTRRHDLVYENHVVVAALARLRDARPGLRATFVGGGPLLERTRASAAAAGLGDRVEFLAQVSHDRMPQLLRAHGISVSAASSDGTSSSLLEAMASGLVPVLTRIAANEAWVKDGVNGLLFEVGDDRGLARAIERAASDVSLRGRCLADNPALVRERGDQRANNRRLLGLLEEAAGHAATRA